MTTQPDGKTVWLRFGGPGIKKPDGSVSDVWLSNLGFLDSLLSQIRRRDEDTFPTIPLVHFNRPFLVRLATDSRPTIRALVYVGSDHSPTHDCHCHLALPLVSSALFACLVSVVKANKLTGSAATF
jgi:hypothetical protein